MKSIIKNFIAKMVAGRSDDGIMITLTDPKKVDFQAAMLEDLLMRNGIDPRAITSEQQLKNLLNQIQAFEKKNLADNIRSGVKNTESAKVFEIATGKEMPKGSQIMGGEAVETEAEIAARLKKGNKDSIQKILDRKNREDVYGLEDYDTTNMSDIKKEIIRTETQLGNLNPNNPDFRERAKPLIDKIEALKNKMRDDKADGGRIGFFKAGLAAGDEISPGTAASSSVDGPTRRDKGPSGPPTVNNTPPKDNKPPVVVNLKKGLTQHNINNQKLKNAVRLGLITDDEYNILGGYDVNQTMGMGPVDTAIASGVYNVYQTMKGDQPASQILGDVKRNVQGSSGLPENLQTKYDNIMAMDSQEMTDQLADLKLAKMADGGRIGFFMGSKFPKGLAALRQMAQYFGKKSDAVKNPSDILKIVNPKRLNQLLENPEIYRKFDIEKGLAAPDMLKILQKQMTGDRQKTIEEMLGAAKNIKRADDNVLKNKNDMIKDMMSKGVDRNMAEEMANTISKMAEGAAGKIDTPKLTDEGILELENILKNMETGGKKKRDLNADGGRIGLKDGMNRRTFLKLLGGFLSIPIIGKIVKPLKTVKGVKNVPVIKTDNVPGKPEWFDQLVNKVIIEGDDVTKRFATQEREIVHTKKINNTDEVTVYQDLNTDSVRVEYNSPKNMLEEPVDLSYKRTPPDEGAPRGSAEFEVTESGFASRADGPDDFFIDAEEVGGSSIKSLESDVSALKQYATGKGPTMKEFVQNKKRIDKVKKLNEGDLDAQSEYIINRQGEADFASGGIAGMLGE